MNLREAIIGGGILPERADVVIREAQRTGLPLAIGCVMLMKESGGGKSVWGHDKTKVPDDVLPYRKGGPVTEQNYRAYLARRGQIGNQGVGPTQLTYPGFQDEADRRGGCWRPEVNIAYGFEILAGYVKSGSVRDAFSRYNTGRPGDTAYGRDAMVRLPKWDAIVRGATPGRRTLRRGDTGPDVRELQRLLNEVGA